MKYFAAVMMLAAIGLVSCKKEYTCECTTTGGGTTVTASGTTKDTKKNAEADCNEGDGSSTVGSTTYTTECELK